MKRVHLICNAHLDPVWLWRWQEGCTEALSTFRTAEAFTEEFPDFVFNHNEAILYEWVKENEPELFARIQQKVKEGKWHIMGGWYLQPDCNMPNGESIIRNISEGHRFFEKEFGVRPTTAINFDSFGHSVGLVQILNQAGYDTYVVAVRRRHSFRSRNRIICGKVWQGRRFWCIVPMKIITPFTGMSEKNWNSSWKIRRTNRCPCISGALATTAADPPEWI